ncbi:MAG: hypothetical protein N3A58_08830 [Spirochaetes bacterium]|nr:hypothetical protein [Spirochaetota bacterium]
MKNTRNKCLILILLPIIFLFLFYFDIPFNREGFINLKLYAENELENEEFKITIDKDSGFFNVYSKKYKVYYFFPSKPLTSIILIKYDTTLIQLDKISAIKREIFLDKDTIVYNFELSYLSFIEKIKFVKIDDLNTGIEVSFEIINKDKRGHYITLGLVVDTYLGESSLTPFRVSTTGLIEKARVYEKTSIPDIIYSLDNPKDPSYGIVFYFRKTGYTVPERIFLSSYDDMVINLFDYKSFSPLSFDSKYKKGDAAIGILFGEKYIEKSQTSINTMLIGFYPILSSEEKKETIDKSSEYLEKYIKEQIEKLNKKLNELKDVLDKAYIKIKDIKKLDEFINKLNDIYKLIIMLEENLNNITLEEFTKKINEISKMIDSLEKEINNYLKD